jgi:Mn2+/Fe2+ NRAMP family transporter
MASGKADDPYFLSAESVENPPARFLDTLKRIGPGLVTASAVVGTGELIATPVLGAENGYTLLWLVVLSCAIKVIVQNELGRYAIGTGETALEAFNRMPGPRLRVSWVVWLWFFMHTTTLMTQSGMLAGIAEVLNRLMPSVSIPVWVWAVTIGTIVLLVLGRYGLIEKISVSLVVCFTLVTMGAAHVLLLRLDASSWRGVLDGLAFHLPQGGILTAVAVFGITGVGSADLTIYPYWCIEKGYARFAGPRDETPAWLGRARGWIRVLGFDVVTSAMVYTFATVAFYLLGAGVLHELGVVPQGTETVRILSNIYTETLGGWSSYLFLAGAVAVFYSSVFAGTAAAARVFADFVCLMRGFGRHDYAARFRWIQIFSALLLLVPVAYYVILREPVLMVKIGGVAQALMLPIVGATTLYLRYVHLPRKILPKGWITLGLWITTAIMAIMMGYSVLRQLGFLAG